MPTHRLLHKRSIGHRRRHRLNAPLAQILINAARVVEQPQCGLESVNDLASLRLIEALVVRAGETIRDAEVARFRDERLVVYKAPNGDEAADATSLLVIGNDPAEPQHGFTS